MESFVGPIWGPWGAKAPGSNACHNMIGNLRPGLQQPLVKLVAPWLILVALYGTHGVPQQQPAVLAKL